MAHALTAALTEELSKSKARIEELEEICKRDRFADGYAVGCEDFKRVGGKRIKALEAALRKILTACNEDPVSAWSVVVQNIARAALETWVENDDDD